MRHIGLTRAVLGMVLSGLCLLWGASRATAEDVAVWIYHNYPPFIVDIAGERGLSFDFARLLTEASDGAFTFRVMVLPRQRLNRRLEAGHSGVVMWVNDAWFGDTERTRFLWTDPILSDRNVVISPTQVAFDYDGPRSLTGMTLIGIRGHRYQDVDRLVGYGLVERVDMRSERSLVQFIASGRGRVAVVARSAAEYFIRELGLDDRIHVAAEPHSSYQRHMLIQPDMEGVHALVQRVLPGLLASDAWAAVIDGYGLSPRLMQ
ncbi:MAG: substrate-binding periplasmic protein [Tateyamaria sp.]